MTEIEATTAAIGQARAGRATNRRQTVDRPLGQQGGRRQHFSFGSPFVTAAVANSPIRSALAAETTGVPASVHSNRAIHISAY